MFDCNNEVAPKYVGLFECNIIARYISNPTWLEAMDLCINKV